MMGSSRGRAVKMQTVLIELMVLVGVIDLSYGAIQRPDYDDTPNPEFLNPSWMASLPDDQPLSEITMPGTHNTMALYGGVYAECQTWSLASQLRAGVRFLDVRVRHVKGNLTIHHGVSYQWAHFGDVLEGVADFLQEYPSETVLMRLKEELSQTYDIYSAVVDYIHRYANWDLLWHSRLVPTVGEARGKLIVLQDFSGPDLGMRYSSLDIADAWKVPTVLHVEEKWKSVYDHLEAAPAGDMARIFLTYSSGAGVFAFPRAVAQLINPQLYDYLTAKKDLNQRLGIICMDFPAAPIIQLIIDFQLRNVTKERQAFNATELSKAKMNPLPRIEGRPQRAAAISSFAVVNIIWWMVMLAAIGFGVTHLRRCPLQPSIPIYLIVLGAASLIALTVTYIVRACEDGVASILCLICTSVLHLFNFTWFIAGTVWIYPVYPPDYTPGAPRYCHKTIYLFAFIITTLVWVFSGILFICGCCCGLLTCSNVRHRLIPTRSYFYGATISDPPESTAGDV